MAESVRECIDRALVAYDELASLGEEVEDEWQYVTDLSATYREHLTDIAAAHGDTPAGEAARAAVLAAIEEIGLITDPHRAIDWLSTFPQLVALAFADRPGAPA
jgi:hypothetical protein